MVAMVTVTCTSFKFTSHTKQNKLVFMITLYQLQAQPDLAIESGTYNIVTYNLYICSSIRTGYIIL